MALFGFNYSKPGPGVNKEEPEKKAFFRFWNLFGAKFWDLLKINMLYFVSIIIFCIPLILTMISIFNSKELNSGSINLITYIAILVSALPLALTGPFTAGFTYLMRNSVRYEHYFLWSDYKDTIKSNIKQSLIASLINVVVFVILIFNLQFYFQSYAKSQIMILPLVLCIFISAMFLFMNYYVFQMIVTFDLKLKQIYKNAFIFAIMGIWRNILVTVLLGLFVVLHVIFVWFSLLFIPFISLGFMGLLINFSSWPIIQKYMIDANNNQETLKRAPSEDNDILFEDKGKER
jgi:uncharacterized membrane protein YesL